MLHGFRVGRTGAGLGMAGLGMTGLALLAAGCGSGGSKVSAASAQPAAATPTTTAPATVRVIEARNATLGTILEDSKGMVLYTYTADAGGKFGCTGACLAYWPPLLLPAGQTAPAAGPGVSGLGTVAAPEGEQVTFRGQPVYTYVADKRPGETSGQNVVDGAGTWLVAVLAAAPSPATTAPPTSTPTTTPPAAPPTTPVTSPPVTHAPIMTSPVTRTPAAPPPPPTSPPMAPPTTAPAGGPSY